MADLTKVKGGFNDIALVDLTIQSAMGILSLNDLGPSDAVIECSPGNEGNVYDVVEGSTGGVLFNKSYKVRNWTIRVRILRHSPDYAKITYMIQEILNAHVTTCGINLVNKNFEDDYYEKLSSNMCVMQNFPGLEFGAGANGDFEVTFKTSNATYESGAYKDYATNYQSFEQGDRSEGTTYQGTDDYTKA